MTLPENAKPYRRTPLFTEATTPAALRTDHSTKDGVWGRIHVESGELTYVVAETGDTTVLRAGQYAVIRPQQRHRVSVDGPVAFFIEFLREETSPG